jgi:hypothetical protein
MRLAQRFTLRTSFAPKVKAMLKINMNATSTLAITRVRPVESLNEGEAILERTMKPPTRNIRQAPDSR